MTKRQLIEALEQSAVPDEQPMLITINTKKGEGHTIYTDVEGVEVRQGLLHIVTLDWRHGE